MRLQTKLLLLLLVVGIVPMYVFTHFLFTSATRNLDERAVEQLESVASIQQQRIADFIQTANDELQLIESKRLLANAAVLFQSGSVAAGQAQMTQTLQEIIAILPHVRGVAVFTPDNATLIGSAGALKHAKAHERSHAQAAGSASFTKGIVDLTNESGSIVAHMVGSLTLDGKNVGALFVDIDTEKLRSLATNYTGLGSTGEMELAYRDAEGRAVMLMPLRFDSGAALTRRIPVTSPSPMIPAVNGIEKTFFNVVDYRGENVYAVTKFIPGVEWGFVVKRDKAEILSLLAPFYRLSIIFLGIAVFLAVLVAVIFSGYLSAPLRSLTSVAKRIADGRFDKPIPLVKTGDEVQELADAFRIMTEKVRFSQGQLLQTLEGKSADLERTSLFLDSIIDNIPDMVFVKDAKDLRFVKFNKAGLELIGTSLENIIGKNDYDFFPKDQADFFTQKDRTVLAGKEVVDIPEEPFDSNRKKGLRILHTKKVPILDEHGEPKYLLGISEDITDRKRAQDELIASRKQLELEVQNTQKFKQAVESSTDGVLITDADTVIVYANPAWQKMSGYSLSDVIGKKSSIVKSDKTPSSVLASLRHAIAHGTSFYSDDIINVRPDGSEYCAELTLFPIRSTPESDVQFYVGLQTDITVRKQQDRAKTEFVSLASHQLRTPLTEIRWALSDLRKGDISESQRFLADVAFKASVHMAETIKSMLTISHIDTNEIKPEPRDVSVDSLIHEIADLMELKRAEKKIDLQFSCPKNLRMHTDAQLLKEILANLLSNAFKYSPERSTVRVTAEPYEHGVHITVADAGIGIPTSEQTRISEKFFRASNAVSGAESGTGIGLYMVYSLVKLLGGSVTFTSDQTSGTSFVLRFPHTA